MRRYLFVRREPSQVFVLTVSWVNVLKKVVLIDIRWTIEYSVEPFILSKVITDRIIFQYSQYCTTITEDFLAKVLVRVMTPFLLQNSEIINSLLLFTALKPNSQSMPLDKLTSIPTSSDLALLWISKKTSTKGSSLSA